MIRGIEERETLAAGLLTHEGNWWLQQAVKIAKMVRLAVWGIVPDPPQLEGGGICSMSARDLCRMQVSVWMVKIWDPFIDHEPRSGYHNHGFGVTV